MKIQYIDLSVDNKNYFDILKSDQAINRYIHVDDIKIYVEYLLKTPNVKYYHLQLTQHEENGRALFRLKKCFFGRLIMVRKKIIWVN